MAVPLIAYQALMLRLGPYACPGQSAAGRGAMRVDRASLAAPDRPYRSGRNATPSASTAGTAGSSIAETESETMRVDMAVLRTMLKQEARRGGAVGVAAPREAIAPVGVIGLQTLI